jgi:outer membrane biosynthesis protein TonB
LGLFVTPEPVVKKLPVEEVRTKPVEEPKVEKKPEKPAAPEPKVAPKPKIKSPDESRTVVEGRERQRSNDPRVQFLLAQANESNVPPSTVQDPQLAQHISGLNLGRSQN